ncbi:MAG: kinase inhibitor [Opitutaceae bacterium]|jgi:inhibitor of KinA|nr:kinase inhibitor [Opitutaceae bacterium]|tara:strand:- start:350 stop:1021 length:672 start_codon:yes stop_codon:yes gene_type:complete
MLLQPMGDTAVVVGFGNVIGATTLEKVRAATIALETNPPLGTLDVMPAFTTITVVYDPAMPGGYATFQERLLACLKTVKRLRRGMVTTLTIPVCYGGEFGPDLGLVAQGAKLSERAAIASHTRPKYIVGAVGFAPGFPYLAGLPIKLHTPRRSNPRLKVPAGSVAIGGKQTGVYPQESPGGWHLIGRTPLKLFNAEEVYPSLLKTGDQVQFKAITAEEFAAWK